MFPMCFQQSSSYYHKALAYYYGKAQSKYSLSAQQKKAEMYIVKGMQNIV